MCNAAERCKNSFAAAARNQTGASEWICNCNSQPARITAEAACLVCAWRAISQSGNRRALGIRRLCLATQRHRLRWFRHRMAQLDDGDRELDSHQAVD